MSLQTETRAATYRAQRAVSQGASITLVWWCGEYTASHECAQHCARLLGSRNLGDDGIYHIPLEDMHAACKKLSVAFSVALVDLVTDDKGHRFVLVWKITPRPVETDSPAEPATLNASDSNQGKIDLDEY